MTENTPLIKTNRLLLRKFTKLDAPAMLSLLKDKEVNTFLPWFPLETLNDTEKHLQENYLEKYNLDAAYHYAICLSSNNIPIGYVNVSDNNSHDLGYGLRKEYWHRGIATEACKAVTARLKGSGLPYITATHDIHNPHSGGVMLNLGMTYRYTYQELCQPKNALVTFRMYQLDLDHIHAGTYWQYWNQNPVHFVEANLETV